MSKEKYVKMCPKCKSYDVFMDSSDPLQGSIGLPPTYECSNCGFRSNVFPEAKLSEIENIEKDKKETDIKKPEKQDKVDTKYGNFTVNIVWKYLGPLLIIGGLLILTRSLSGLISLAFGIIITYFAFKKK